MLDYRKWKLPGLVIWFASVLAVALALDAVVDSSSASASVRVLAGAIELAVVATGILVLGRSYSAWARRRRRPRNE
jgi:hypothetical protein